MAVNKRKILEAARKYAQKGSKERALKEYEKLIALDPRDAKLRLEIGDAHRRWGQVDAAISAYTKVAEQYTREGFDARAVAVYKQIQNLDSDRYDTFEPLAELYQRMGLMSEAVNALQTAADGYHRDGKKPQALELLRKMASLDPSNTGSRIKVADLLRQEGLTDEAVVEYDAAAQELIRQGEPDSACKVLERILELEPARVASLRTLAKLLVERGAAERAEPYAKRLLERESGDTDHYELLAEIYRALGRDEDLTDIYRRLADVYMQRGDEDQARAIRQRFLAPEAISLGDSDAEELLEETVLETLAEPGAAPAAADFGEELLEEELLEEEILDEHGPDLGGGEGRAPGAPGLAEPTLLSPAPAPESPRQANRVPTVDPDADPEQLLAEASVYLRYGKREQAVANLEAILARDPDCRPALEKLGEAHADAGRRELAVEHWLRAAELAGAAGDAAARSVLRDRIAALDEAAAARLAASAAESAPEEPAPEMAAAPGPAAAAEPEAVDDPSETLPEEELGSAADPDPDLDEIEIDIDEASFRRDAPAEPEPEPEPEGAEAGLEEVALDTADFDGESQGASLSQRITEDLEEAEFYTQQGLHEEAESIYKRLLELAPNHPLVQVRLGEIAAARGDDPGASGAGGTAVDDDATPAGSSLGEDLGDWSEPDLPAAAEDGATGAQAAAPEADAPLEIAADPDDLSADDLGDASDLDLDGSDESPEEEVAAAAAPAAPPRGAEVTEPGFDLAAELSDVFDAEDPGASASGLGDSADDFAAVFQEFKRGVSRTLSEGDHEAHYDLGIAYREMGLLGDAATEFRAASGSPALRVECLHLMGLCALDQGQPRAALGHLEGALADEGSTAEQQLAARFALGRALEALGEAARAREAFEAVAAVDPGFCEVDERLRALAEPEKPPGAPAADAADAADDALESFEDMLAEVEAEGAPADAAPERLEDFADLVDDAEDAPEGAPPPEPPALAPEPAPASPEPASEASDSPPPRRRKKKISFV